MKSESSCRDTILDLTCRIDRYDNIGACLQYLTLSGKPENHKFYSQYYSSPRNSLPPENCTATGGLQKISGTTLDNASSRDRYSQLNLPQHKGPLTSCRQTVPVNITSAPINCSFKTTHEQYPEPNSVVGVCPEVIPWLSSLISSREVPTK